MLLTSTVADFHGMHAVVLVVVAAAQCVHWKGPTSPVSMPSWVTTAHALKKCFCVRREWRNLFRKQPNCFKSLFTDSCLERALHRERLSAMETHLSSFEFRTFESR